MWQLLALFVGAAAIDWWRNLNSPGAAPALGPSVSVAGLPDPSDAIAWEELSGKNAAVRAALVFWGNLTALENQISSPSWIELTTGEQRALVDGWRDGDPKKLLSVIESALNRAEPRTPDAVRLYSNDQLVRMLTQGDLQ